MLKININNNNNKKMQTLHLGEIETVSDVWLHGRGS